MFVSQYAHFECDSASNALRIYDTFQTAEPVLIYSAVNMLTVEGSSSDGAGPRVRRITRLPHPNLPRQYVELLEFQSTFAKDCLDEAFLEARLET